MILAGGFKFFGVGTAENGLFKVSDVAFEICTQKLPSQVQVAHPLRDGRRPLGLHGGGQGDPDRLAAEALRRGVHAEGRGLLPAAEAGVAAGEFGDY